MRVARGAGRGQVKEPPPICLTWVDECAMLFEIVRRNTMASQIFKWIGWVLGALFASIMVFTMAGTGVMFIMNAANWLTVVIGWGCLTLSVILVTLMFLIVHTMDH